MYLEEMVYFNQSYFSTENEIFHIGIKFALDTIVVFALDAIVVFVK
jgi:hypothetical protein